MKRVAWFVAVIFLAAGLFAFAGEAFSEAGAVKPGVNAPSAAGAPPGAEPSREGSPQDIPEWKARWELARLLSYVKRYQESIAEYDKLLREKPDLLEAKIEMARVLYWGGQIEKAYEVLEPIPMEQIPEESRTLVADLHVARKEYAKAEPIYRQHLERHPEDLKARLSLAEVLSWTRRYPESLSQYEILLKARPDDIQVRRKYAFVLSWSGRHADAIAELRRTLP
jgi:tetratricopeptide (TPR) repeat protein